MSYSLLKPYTDKQRLDFIVQYNHNLNLEIYYTPTGIYALEPNEILVNGKPEINPDYETEQAKLNKQRIAHLSLTRGDVFRGLLLAKGITRAQIKSILESLPESTPEELITKELALIDFDEALNFYRGKEIIDAIGARLGITSEQLDMFFETNDYTFLNYIPEDNTDAGYVVEEDTYIEKVEPEEIYEDTTYTTES